RMLTVIALPRSFLLPRHVAAARQPYDELGEGARLALDHDRAAMLLRDDVVADRQTEPGALPGRLGGEEGLEQLVLDLRRNADAVVAHLDLDGFADTAGRHRQHRPELRP